MKKIKGFTLIELLIVMGILVILIGTAIIVSRWAIRRSNIIAHKDAARSLEVAILAFKNDNGFVPQVLNCGNSDNPPFCYTEEFFRKAFGDVIGSVDILSEYLDSTPFDGGGDATYYYTTDDQGQYFVVCVSLGGFDDEQEWGFYCTGTGLGFLPEGNPIKKQDIDPDDGSQTGIIKGSNVDDSDWCKNSLKFSGACI